MYQRELMDVDEAIKILGDAEVGVLTLDAKFKAAVKMGKIALTLLAHDKSHRLDDWGLTLILSAKRGEHGKAK